MEKKIIVKITPAAVLLAVLLLVGALLLHRGIRQEKRSLSIDATPVIITKIRSLGELTTACYYDEMVLSRTKQNAFSSSALGSLARDGLGKDVDDHLVIIAKGTVRAGVDLMDMTEEDIRFVGDTAYIRLHGPAAAPDGRRPLRPQIQGLRGSHGRRYRTSRRLRLHLHPFRPPRLLHPHAPARRVSGLSGRSKRDKRIFFVSLSD